MKHTLSIALCLGLATLALAQPKPRPDAFPPEPLTFDTKAVTMATTVEEMAGWDRYPTYSTYLAMMARWAEEFPRLCHVDTIGTSVQGRLILSLYIEPETDSGNDRPEFFYSSTIHGDEVTGYVMMLRLIDTLLRGYGSNPQYTSLINRTRISINPLANPDGTYWRGDNTLLGARRYNANGIDLNRNFPDPFQPAKAGIPQENQAMIDYFTAHNFRLSANLHGGAEVMNYPWDSFRSNEMPHPDSQWWEAVGHRFVDTSHTYDNSHFRDVTQADNGVIAGGDWYVIGGGRQDYVNYYHHCLEMTMEISSDKVLSTSRLNEYWGFLQHSLVNYIEEIHSLPENSVIPDISGLQSLNAYPNPTSGKATLSGVAINEPVWIYSITGNLIGEIRDGQIDLSRDPQGVYIIRTKSQSMRLLKY